MWSADVNNRKAWDSKVSDFKKDIASLRIVKHNINKISTTSIRGVGCVSVPSARAPPIRPVRIQTAVPSRSAGWG